MSKTVTYELLKGFIEAFNRHDLEMTVSSICLEEPGRVAIDMSGRRGSEPG